MQSEIAYFRQRRGGEDVVVGETIGGFVQQIRDDGKMNIGLRPFGTDRIEFTKQQVLDALEGSPSGIIPIGDKTAPEDIGRYIYGISKTDFKNAIGALYRDGIVTPGEFETRLIPEEMRNKSHVPSSRGKKLAEILKTDSKSVRDDSKTIFIGNLPFTVNDKILQNVLSKALGNDKIAKIRLVMDDETKKPRGYAFLDLKDEKDVAGVVDMLSGLEVMGRRLRADPSKPSEKKSYETPRLQATYHTVFLSVPYLKTLYSLQMHHIKSTLSQLASPPTVQSSYATVSHVG